MCINCNVMCKVEIILGVLYRILIRCVSIENIQDATTHPLSPFIVQSHSSPEKNEISCNRFVNVIVVNQYVCFLIFFPFRNDQQ